MVRTLGCWSFLFLVVAGLLCNAGTAEAGRHCGGCVVVAPVVVAPAAPMRQCRGTYFDTAYSTWCEVDVLVPFHLAAVGTSYDAFIPRVGSRVQVWITHVYTIPRVKPPEFDTAAQ
jgi:hypothetical protein